MVPENRPMSSRSTANYAELANELLDRIPIDSNEDAQTAAIALRRLIIPPESASSSAPPLVGRVEVIEQSIDSVRELLENPDIYTRPELHETFRRIVRDRIASKIQELEKLTPRKVEKTKEWQQKRHQQAAEYQRMVANRTPPAAFSAAHTISEEQALVEHFGSGGGGEVAPADENPWPRREIITDRREALEAVRQDGLMLENVSDELKNDEEIVLAAVRQDSMALQYASDAMKRNRRVVLAAGQQNQMALVFANDELKGDRNFALELVQLNGLTLPYLNPAFLDDKEIALAAVRQDSRAFTYISERLRQDPDILQVAPQFLGRPPGIRGRSSRSPHA